jgi:hypothetical protein
MKKYTLSAFLQFTVAEIEKMFSVFLSPTKAEMSMLGFVNHR